MCLYCILYDVDYVFMSIPPPNNHATVLDGTAVLKTQRPWVALASWTWSSTRIWASKAQEFRSLASKDVTMQIQKLKHVSNVSTKKEKCRKILGHCRSPACCYLETTTCKVGGGPGTSNSPEALLLEHKTANKSQALHLRTITWECLKSPLQSKLQWPDLSEKYYFNAGANRYWSNDQTHSTLSQKLVEIWDHCSRRSRMSKTIYLEQKPWAARIWIWISILVSCKLCNTTWQSCSTTKSLGSLLSPTPSTTEPPGMLHRAKANLEEV